MRSYKRVGLHRDTKSPHHTIIILRRIIIYFRNDRKVFPSIFKATFNCKTLTYCWLRYNIL